MHRNWWKPIDWFYNHRALLSNAAVHWEHLGNYLPQISQSDSLKLSDLLDSLALMSIIIIHNSRAEILQVELIWILHNQFVHILISVLFDLLPDSSASQQVEFQPTQKESIKRLREYIWGGADRLAVHKRDDNESNYLKISQNTVQLSALSLVNFAQRHNSTGREDRKRRNWKVIFALVELQMIVRHAIRYQLKVTDC